jgi:uncharacterized membrane protein YgcG
MFAKLFALFFGKKKEPEKKFAHIQMQERVERFAQPRYVEPLRTGKSSRASVTYSPRQSEDIMSNPSHPLNPLNPIGFNSAIYQDSTSSHSSHSSSYDCGSSSSSSYDSGSSSSCDSGSSSSGGGD